MRLNRNRLYVWSRATKRMQSIMAILQTRLDSAVKPIDIVQEKGILLLSELHEFFSPKH